MMKFKPVEKSDKPIFDKFYKARYYENGQYTFTNLYVWRKFLSTQWSVKNDVLYTLVNFENKVSMLQPLGSQDKMQEAIANIIEFFETNEKDKELSLLDIDKNFVEELEKFPDAKFDIKANRDAFDYVYFAEDLIKLAGKKYNLKKTPLNGFHRNYPEAKYLPITEELIPKCREEAIRWNESRAAQFKDDSIFEVELETINEAFDNFFDFNLKGGAIELDGRVIAFTVGEQLNADTAVVHIEKAERDIRGSYAAINQGFVANEWSEMKYINREEDMGIEGLRKAKESYNPCKMIEQFNANLIK